MIRGLSCTVSPQSPWESLSSVVGDSALRREFQYVAQGTIRFGENVNNATAPAIVVHCNYTRGSIGPMIPL
jgi:hypothetical protein